MTLRAMQYPDTRDCEGSLKIILLRRGNGGQPNRRVLSIFRALGFWRISGRGVILSQSLGRFALKIIFVKITFVPIGVKLAGINSPGL